MIEWTKNDSDWSGHRDQNPWNSGLNLDQKGKVAQVNYRSIEASHFVGQFNTVLFAPEDMQLIKGHLIYGAVS